MYHTHLVTFYEDDLLPSLLRPTNILFFSSSSYSKWANLSHSMDIEVRKYINMYVRIYMSL